MHENGGTAKLPSPNAKEFVYSSSKHKTTKFRILSIEEKRTLYLPSNETYYNKILQRLILQKLKYQFTLSDMIQ